jgi:subtilisin family serine protease
MNRFSRRIIILNILLALFTTYCVNSALINLQHTAIDTDNDRNLLVDLLQEGKTKVMKRSLGVRSETKSIQFIITLKNNVRAYQVEDLIGKKVERYLPPDSFIVYSNPDELGNELRKNDRIVEHYINWVGHMKPQYKTNLNLAEKQILGKNEREVVLSVSLAVSSIENGKNLKKKIESLFKGKAHATVESANTIKVHSSPKVASVLLYWLKNQEDIHWIDRSLPMKVHNHGANIIVQGSGDFSLSPPEVTPIWDRNITGAGEIVSVADTGLDFDNCFFYDPDHPVERDVVNFENRKVVAYFVVGNGTDDFGDFGDAEGHGTHVSGSVAGELLVSNSNTELRRWEGSGKGAKLVFQDISGADGALRTGDLYALFSFSYNQTGSVIHTNSFGCSPALQCSYDCVCTDQDDNPVSDEDCIANFGTRCCQICNMYDSDSQSVDRFLYDFDDNLVLFSAGNSGGTAFNGTITAPSTAKNALTVGASTNLNSNFVDASRYTDPTMFDYSDEDECCAQGVANCCPRIAETLYPDRANIFNQSNLAGFSSRGPTQDGRIKPDVVAPGYTVVSMHNDGNLNSRQCGTERPNGDNSAALTTMQGTSMSAPITAGAAALVRQYYRDYRGVESPSGPLLKATLIHSGTPLPGIVVLGDNSIFNLPGVPNVFDGFGLVTLSNVLQFEDSQFQLFYEDRMNITDGETHSFSYQSNSTSDDSSLKVTLTYYDLPSEPSIAGSLINDLDLVVLYNNGDEVVSVFGNGGEAADRLNNVEQVVIADIAAGTNFTISVTAHRLQTESQKYSIVITGVNIEQLVV